MINEEKDTEAMMRQIKHALDTLASGVGQFAGREVYPILVNTYIGFSGDRDDLDRSIVDVGICMQIENQIHTLESAIAHLSEEKQAQQSELLQQYLNASAHMIGEAFTSRELHLPSEIHSSTINGNSRFSLHYGEETTPAHVMISLWQAPMVAAMSQGSIYAPGYLEVMHPVSTDY